MKKAKDEMRAGYKRSDFAKLERGKFYKEVAKGSSIAVLEPEVAKAFPTSAAVNKALLDLLTLARQSTRIRNRSTPVGTKTERAN